MNHIFERTVALLGEENFNILAEKKIAVIGVGGVGSFIAESLARAGVKNLTLMDFETIDETNINRQIHATTKTIGQVKVYAMAKRILDINPDINVNATNIFLDSTNIAENVRDFDFVCDAIDIVTSKIALIEHCFKNNINIISSMGAGNKLHPELFEISDIYKTSVCPLAKVLRKELKARDVKRLAVCYSKEQPITPKFSDDIMNERKIPKGSISFVPSACGLIIAGYVVRELLGLE